MRRRLFRAPRALASPWRWVVVVVGSAFAVTGWATTGVGSDEPVMWAGVVIGVLVVAMGLALGAAGLLSRVQLAEGRLTFRDPWRRRTVLAQEVQAVGVQTVDDKLLWQASAPVLLLSDGRTVALMALAGISYGQWRTPLLRRNVAALLDWWGGDPAATPLVVSPSSVTSAPPSRSRVAVEGRSDGSTPASGDLDGPFRRGSSSPAGPPAADAFQRPAEPAPDER